MNKKVIAAPSVKYDCIVTEFREILAEITGKIGQVLRFSPDKSLSVDKRKSEITTHLKDLEAHIPKGDIIKAVHELKLWDLSKDQVVIVDIKNQYGVGVKLLIGQEGLIPLHDHKGMFVLADVLEGDANVHAWSKTEVSEELSLPVDLLVKEGAGLQILVEPYINQVHELKVNGIVFEIQIPRYVTGPDFFKFDDSTTKLKLIQLTEQEVEKIFPHTCFVGESVCKAMRQKKIAALPKATPLVFQSQGKETQHNATLIATPGLRIFLRGKYNKDTSSPNNDFVFVDEKKGVYAVIDGMGDWAYSAALATAFIVQIQEALKSWDGVSIDRVISQVKRKSIEEARKRVADTRGGIVFRVCHFNAETRLLTVVGCGDVDVIGINNEGVGRPIVGCAQNGTQKPSLNLLTDAPQFEASNIVDEVWRDSLANSSNEKILSVTVEDSITCIAIATDGISEQLWVEPCRTADFYYRDLELAIKEPKKFATRMEKKYELAQYISILKYLVTHSPWDEVMYGVDYWDDTFPLTFQTDTKPLVKRWKEAEPWKSEVNKQKFLGDEVNNILSYLDKNPDLIPMTMIENLKIFYKFLQEIKVAAIPTGNPIPQDLFKESYHPDSIPRPKHKLTDQGVKQALRFLEIRLRVKEDDMGLVMINVSK